MCSPQATIQVKYRAGILASGGLCPHGQDSVCLPPNEVRLSSFPQWVMYSRPQHQNTEYRKQPEPKLQMYLNTAASCTRVAFKVSSLVWQLYSCIHYSTGNMPGVELLGIYCWSKLQSTRSSGDKSLCTCALQTMKDAWCCYWSVVWGWVKLLE